MFLSVCFQCQIKARYSIFFVISFQGQVMFRNGERMGTIKFNQFQGMWDVTDTVVLKSTSFNSLFRVHPFLTVCST